MLALTTAGLALVQPPLVARTSAPSANCGQLDVAPEPTLLGRRAVLSSAAALTLTALPAAAPAESTLVTRQAAYTRYVPRIERGRDYWATKLRKDIANRNWADIQKELVPVGKKDAGGALKKVLGPMGLWSSSFSSKVISEKTVAMNLAVDELEQAIASLEIAAYGEEKDGGIFGIFGAKKKLDDNSRVALAQAAYKKGTRALNKYIEIGNDNLGLNFAPLDTID